MNKLTTNLCCLEDRSWFDHRNVNVTNVHTDF